MTQAIAIETVEMDLVTADVMVQGLRRDLNAGEWTKTDRNMKELRAAIKEKLLDMFMLDAVADKALVVKLMTPVTKHFWLTQPVREVPTIPAGELKAEMAAAVEAEKAE